MSTPKIVLDPVGCPALVTHNAGEKSIQGTLLSVRWSPDPKPHRKLLAFVVYRDSDRRNAQWLDAEKVVAFQPPSMNQAPKPVSAMPAPQPFSQPVKLVAPLINRSIHAPISPEERKCFSTQMDFLEERLRRDMDAPNSLRYLHYLTYTIPVWYYSPFHVLYPEFDPTSPVVPDAFLCPFTLRPFIESQQLIRHLEVFSQQYALRPPGTEVYRDEDRGISLFRVDGEIHRDFCRNLSLLGKAFLHNKLSGHDPDIYTFYVAAVHQRTQIEKFCNDSSAMFVAGYFSHEKGDAVHNLACIVTLPCFQGQGIGHFLIASSYEAAYRRGHVGGPERPLSDLGEVAYHKFWTHRVWQWAAQVALRQQQKLTSLRRQREVTNKLNEEEVDALKKSMTLKVRIQDVAEEVKLEEADVLETMLRMGLVHRTEGKLLKVVVPVDVAEKEAMVNFRLPFDHLKNMM